MVSQIENLNNMKYLEIRDFSKFFIHLTHFIKQWTTPKIIAIKGIITLYFSQDSVTTQSNLSHSCHMTSSYCMFNPVIILEMNSSV